ncbi:molybdate ABC transporter substrate-binding protein [Oceanobacillus arenosus]|uniref:Molybdate ABC transporter substrate-binding protein n=2 Tax=Oceanobacillus arenosus TaxID=1229153 RepID=A0A3D8PX70_9BACI|nr:molybdate ABC transporter substrate-binding protein [Oceanobacillus arenosus]
MKRVMILFIFLVLTACAENEEPVESAETVELTVSAAASLKDAMDVIADKYEEENQNITLQINYGGSGSLQQQISQGAPADLFFSAAEDKFDLLVEERNIEEEDGIDLLGNELVLIAPTDGAEEMEGFQELINENVDKISIGTPETVPAGAYAIESFEAMGIWNDIESKVVYAKDVRQVLSYVETGNVSAGVVYKTDALISDEVAIVETADPKTHTPIIYPLGVIKDSKHYEEAQDFYQFLQSEDALKVFRDYGFTAE